MHFAAQGGQIGFKDAPNHFIGDESVAMDQPVAKRDDPAAVTNMLSEVRVQAEGLIEGFPMISNCRSTADLSRASAM